MIDDQLERKQGQNPSTGKLVLPGPSESYSSSTRTQGVYIPPGYNGGRKIPSAPNNPLSQLQALWQRDPAYKVLFISIGMILVAGLSIGTLIGVVLAHPLSSTTANAPIPQSTTFARPVFPPPTGGKGSTSSSQPPQNPTPVIQNPLPPVTTMPSPPITQPTQPIIGNTTITVTGIPTIVKNGSVVSVNVMTNTPDVSVRLQATYNLPPGVFFSGTRITDANGMATLTWTVHVTATVLRTTATTAQVVVTGVTADGQPISSPTFTVEIIL